MVKFLSTREAAEEMGVSLPTIRRWIQAGRLRAIRAPGGAYRIPAQAIIVAKQNAGLLPPIPRSTGLAHVETYENLPDFYRRTIEPRLRELDLSAEDVLLRAAEDRVFARSHRRLLGDRRIPVNVATRTLSRGV